MLDRIHGQSSDLPKESEYHNFQDVPNIISSDSEPENN